jgi:hypothetical protein
MLDTKHTFGPMLSPVTQLCVLDRDETYSYTIYTNSNDQVNGFPP